MNTSKKLNRRCLVSLLSLIGLLWSGCFLILQPATFPDLGRFDYLYTLAGGSRVTGEDILAIEVNKAQRNATFFMNNKPPVYVTLLDRESQTWPTGCPTNIGSTKMEILYIDQKPLKIGNFTFAQPVLVKNCPKDSPQIILREDGQVGGGGNACVGATECLIFEMEPSRTSALTAPLLNAKPLPHAEKGYELYSWFESDESRWLFTLTTGTNRLKTYEEISADDNTVTADGWVKITLVGSAALADMLGRLPEGEFIYWRGGAWLADVKPASGNVIFPADNDIKSIDHICREQGLKLLLTP